MKERIIGAVVLVAVVVLVVPVFLDGPPADGETVTERVPLPGQADQAMQTVVLNRDRDAPVPSPTVETRERPASREPAVSNETAQQAVPPPVTAAQPEAREEQPEPETRRDTAPAAVASSTGMWAVQLGSFSQQENAEKLAAGLRKQGFAAFLSQVDVESGQLHRVRIGPQKDRDAAEAMAARLATAGHTGQVVPHP